MAWLTGWRYRKAITLSHASGAVSNHRMLLLVGETSGATGEAVDCAGHCKTDFGDLRFTNAAGDLLPYWIESITGATPNQLAAVWIKFDSIGTGATTFYMYYGNAAASSLSSGADTFTVFDNFERGNNGDAIGGGWTVAAGSVVISTEHAYGGTRSMKCVGGAATPSVSIPVTAGSGVSIRMRIWKEDAAEVAVNHGDGATRGVVKGEADEDVTVLDGVTYQDTGSNITADQWQLLELNNWNWVAQTVDVWLNGTKIATGADISYANGSYANAVGLWGVNAAGVDFYIDDFIVRDFLATEAEWGVWGPEIFTLAQDAVGGVLISGSPTIKRGATVQASGSVLVSGSPTFGKLKHRIAQGAILIGNNFVQTKTALQEASGAIVTSGEFGIDSFNVQIMVIDAVGRVVVSGTPTIGKIKKILASGGVIVSFRCVQALKEYFGYSRDTLGVPVNPGQEGGFASSRSAVGPPSNIPPDGPFTYRRN